MKSNVHINPKFQQKATNESSSSSAVQNVSNVHINPNFAARPLPQIPGTETAKGKNQFYVNPSFLVIIYQNFDGFLIIFFTRILT